ncbi:MAG: hypothetical protein K9J37_12905 [Saprospiraceae bacterium]|nr:hypothetical protein [Saprospiraceae bacterium]MCF8250807.1 hypothetical protein [Saprospiraceae bacterium]MCF8282691.1 hypothetical protein [Bacteroidales bacterium]MCF8312608.1 hypothetical protein [Saprospiraceae bacterium]MCF8440998.1 hypothetical protein [Saprospiraceae bacterium]
MVKYLQQLLADIEHAIQMASQLPAQDWISDYEDEEAETTLAIAKLFKFSEIYDLPFEAFPPEKLLSDVQVIYLLDSIHQLWSSWRLRWELPLQLSDRQHYSALLYAMEHEVVAWTSTIGGDVVICQYEEGGFCPFGKENGYCHCKEIDDSVQHDLAIWEEHVRSQGLDPYQYLSEEEGKAFEDTMRNQQIRKQFGDEWEKFCTLDFYTWMDFQDKDDRTTNNDYEDQDWVEGWLYNDDISFNDEDSWDVNDDKKKNDNLLDGSWGEGDFE